MCYRNWYQAVMNYHKNEKASARTLRRKCSRFYTWYYSPSFSNLRVFYLIITVYYSIVLISLLSPVPSVLPLIFSIVPHVHSPILLSILARIYHCTVHSCSPCSSSFFLSNFSLFPSSFIVSYVFSPLQIYHVKKGIGNNNPAWKD